MECYNLIRPLFCFVLKTFIVKNEVADLFDSLLVLINLFLLHLVNIVV